MFTVIQKISREPDLTSVETLLRSHGLWIKAAKVKKLESSSEKAAKPSQQPTKTA